MARVRVDKESPSGTAFAQQLQVKGEEDLVEVTLTFLSSLLCKQDFLVCYQNTSTDCGSPRMAFWVAFRALCLLSYICQLQVMLADILEVEVRTSSGASGFLCPLYSMSLGIHPRSFLQPWPSH